MSGATCLSDNVPGDFVVMCHVGRLQPAQRRTQFLGHDEAALQAKDALDLSGPAPADNYTIGCPQVFAQNDISVHHRQGSRVQALFLQADRSQDFRHFGGRHSKRRANGRAVISKPDSDRLDAEPGHAICR